MLYRNVTEIIKTFEARFFLKEYIESDNINKHANSLQIIENFTVQCFYYFT